MKTVVNKNYLDEMMKDVYLNSITVEKFFEYYSNLKKYISNSKNDGSIRYVIGLKQSKIESTDTIDDEILIYNSKLDLENSLKEIIIKTFENNKIDLIQYFEDMTFAIENCVLSLDDYYSYADMVSLTIMLDSNKIDILEYAKKLFDSSVNYPKTYNDQIRYSQYQKQLSEQINELQTKIKFKRFFVK